MTLARALQHHGLEGWLKQIARPNVRSGELLIRLKQHPRLAETVTSWPKSLASIRDRLQCPALHGGARPPHGKPCLAVWNGRITSQNSLTIR